MVATGLQTMHANNVLHRDIKSDNILCRPNGDIKIADLGLSIFLSQQQMFRKTQKGTQNWYAPEITKGVFYSKEVDVWAFGCLAYELATGLPPFQDLQSDSLITAIQSRSVPPIPEKWSPDFFDFINRCLEKNP
jgi:serine/threonine protein kinase